MNKATKQISKLFAAMAMAGVASYSVAADTIKIALAGPVTGAVAQYGEMQFIGAKRPSSRSTRLAASTAQCSKVWSMTTPAIRNKPWQ